MPTPSQADSHRKHASLGLGLCGLLVALSTGCAQKPLCAALGNCGGNPAGSWVLGGGHASCSEDLYTPPTDTRLDRGDQPAARTPPAEEALYDWCDLLVTNGGAMVAMTQPHFSFENSTIGAAFIHYDPIPMGASYGTYAALLTRTGTYTIQFPALCIREFGATGDVCGKLATQLMTSSAHKDLICAADSTDPQGCICQFDVGVQSGGSGVYSMPDSHTIVHEMNLKYPAKTTAADFPQQVTFCNQGTSLELTGADDAYLFNESGLRTMSLASSTSTCSDGVQGPGEEGIDCGLVCPNPCMAPATPMPATM